MAGEQLVVDEEVAGRCGRRAGQDQVGGVGQDLGLAALLLLQALIQVTDVFSLPISQAVYPVQAPR